MLGVVRPKGNTAFYDACYLAIDKVQHGRYAKRVLIVVSDGQDNTSHYSLDKVREALRESDVLVYSIDVASRMNAGSSLDYEGHYILDELSALSGGKFFYVKGPKDSTIVFEIIGSELRYQYTIAVLPTTPAVHDSAWHKIQLKVTQPAKPSGDMKHVYVRTREGFYFGRQ
jgi:Ca-activated chloride channel family protein